VLRRKAPDLPRPFRTPWVPFVPIAGGVICFAQMVGLPLATWERLFIWLAAGLVVYVMYSHRRALSPIVVRSFILRRSSGCPERAFVQCSGLLLRNHFGVPTRTRQM